MRLPIDTETVKFAAAGIRNDPQIRMSSDAR
jgi:hypothetical protein